jgi:hypothetical protein
MATSADTGVFPYPVGILLHNRPEYAEQTLAALASQKLAIDQSRLVIVRDGYVGSRDEAFGDPDFTAEVDRLAERFFPDATHIRFEQNCGIAVAYEEMADWCFSGNADWAAFFEEDFVVDQDYTQVLERLIDATAHVPQVASLSATGDISVNRNRGWETFYPDRHLWAYALRRTVREQWRETQADYLKILEHRPYWDRDTDAIVSGMAERGMLIPGSSQDYVKFGFMRANGYLALNTAHAHGHYIGRVGLHHTDEIFAASGYDVERAPRDVIAVIPSVTPELLVELEHESRSLWARENLGYRLSVIDRLESIRRRNLDLSSLLHATQEDLAEQKALNAKGENPASDEARNEQDDRGGWTWFGGSSALSIGKVHLLGIVRRKGVSLKGQSCLVVMNESGRIVRSIPLLRDLRLDDHNVPTVVAFGENRFVVAVTGHGSVTSVLVAVGVVRDGDIRLGPRLEVEFGEPTSYAHIVPEGKESFLLLTRCARQNFKARRVNVSSLEVTSESMPVFPWAVDENDPWYSGMDGNRPYLITREDGSDVLFALTNDHPRAYRNGIVAGRFRGAEIFDLDDKLVHTLDVNAPMWDPFSQLTQIVDPGQRDIPWVHDIAPVVRDGASIGVDVAYSLAEMSDWSFRRWGRGRHPGLKYAVSRRLLGQDSIRVFEADAGPSLCADEAHYAGGIALNPRNSDHIVYSVGVVPPAREGSPKPQPQWRLMSRELTHGVEQRRIINRRDLGDSVIRPVFSNSAPGAQSHGLFVMNGRYSTYRDFATRIHATTFRVGESCADISGEHLDLMYAVELEGAMPHEETVFLRRQLRRARSYLEFGAGGSTLIALAGNVPIVTSVEPDARLAWYLESLAVTSRSNYTCHVPHVSEISAWGFPVSEGDPTELGREYAHAADGSSEFDTVLIDGRFRVACALAVAASVTSKTTLMIDDYGDRAHYKILERYLGRPRMKGRLAVFTLRRPVNVSKEALHDAYRDAR